MMRNSLIQGITLRSLFASSSAAQQGTQGEWHLHGGDAGYTRYSSLDQVTADNVTDLDIVWRRPSVDTSVTSRWPDLRHSNQLQSTPIMIDGVLYASNSIGLLEAFDPANGETIWVQDTTFLGSETPRGTAGRSVAYWESDNDRRLFAWVLYRSDAADA